jgi:hypothetical protein
MWSGDGVVSSAGAVDQRMLHSHYRQAEATVGGTMKVHEEEWTITTRARKKLLEGGCSSVCVLASRSRKMTLVATVRSELITMMVMTPRMETVAATATESRTGKEMVMVAAVKVKLKAQTVAATELMAMELMANCHKRGMSVRERNQRLKNSDSRIQTFETCGSNRTPSIDGSLVRRTHDAYEAVRAACWTISCDTAVHRYATFH